MPKTSRIKVLFSELVEFYERGIFLDGLGLDFSEPIAEVRLV